MTIFSSRQARSARRPTYSQPISQSSLGAVRVLLDNRTDASAT